MLTEPQRAKMLAVMGIDVYRLHSAAVESADPAWIFIDAQARICVSGVREDAPLAWLPPALCIPAAQVRYCDEEASDGVMLDNGAMPRDAAGKRKLWQSLKPLAKRVHNPV